MDEVLIDAGDYKPRYPNDKVIFFPASSFDAAYEIAEAFGNIPWKPKEEVPKEAAPNTDRKSECQGVPPEPKGAGFGCGSVRLSISSHGFRSGGFEDDSPQGTFAFGQNSSSSLVYPTVSSLSRHSRKGGCNVSHGQDNDGVFSPIAPSTTFASLSPGGFSAPPPNPYSSSFSSAIGGPFGSSRTSHISGFGCSNEAIARLPGRSRGKGRRGNSERHRGNKTDQGNTGTNAFLSSDSGNNNNNNMKDISQRHDEDSMQSPQIGGRRSTAFGDEQKGEEVPSKRRCGIVCTICGKMGHSSHDCYSNPKNQCNREAISVLGCYNCNERGHMAVRCTKPPMKLRHRRVSSTKSGRRKASTAENGQKETTATQNKSTSSDMKGLEVICKLMKDKHLREEAAKKTPQLFDEMLSYMIEHISLSGSSK